MPYFGVGDLGIVRDRGRCPPNGPKSEHCDGARAWDPKCVAPSVVGDQMFAWAIRNADRLGIQSVIWNRRVWGYGNETVRPYHGTDPHTGHLHIGLNRWAAANLTEAMVKATFTTDEGGWLNMLTDQEQQELLEKVRRIDDVLSKNGAEWDPAHMSSLNAAILRVEGKVDDLKSTASATDTSP
jgi:hypothetical protein